jgi:hypothetical protein
MGMNKHGYVFFLVPALVSLGVTVDAQVASRWPEGFDKDTLLARTSYDNATMAGELALYRRQLRKLPASPDLPGHTLAEFRALESSKPPGDRKPDALAHIQPFIFFLVATPRANSETRRIPWLVYLGDPGLTTHVEVAWNRDRGRAHVVVATSNLGVLTAAAYEVDPREAVSSYPIAWEAAASRWPRPSEALVVGWRRLRGATDRSACLLAGGGLSIRRLGLLSRADRLLAYGQRDAGCEDVYFGLDLATQTWLELTPRDPARWPFFGSWEELQKATAAGRRR